MITARVTRVIDGDTIEADIAGKVYKVRYLGIDAPEGSKEATDHNSLLVQGKTVRLEKDITETDKFERLLRYVWVGNALVNAELVRLGYAQVVTYPPDIKYEESFLKLQREAMQTGKGLWASVSLTPAPTSSPVIPTATPTTTLPAKLTLQIVYVTSPISSGANATLTAKTTPGASATITVYYKSGPSTAQGLYPKVADSSGNVSWTWKVGTNTTPGSWRIEIKASLSGETLSQTTYFEVR